MLDYLSCISFPWGITIFEVSSLGSSSVFLDLPVLLFPLVAEMLDYLSCISFPWPTLLNKKSGFASSCLLCFCVGAQRLGTVCTSSSPGSPPEIETTSFYSRGWLQAWNKHVVTEWLGLRLGERWVNCTRLSRK
jgi:hypothetical protein